MLRRDFFKAVSGFVAATAAARAAVVAAGLPADQRLSDVQRGVAPRAAEAALPALELRREFEKVIVDCIRDGSLRCVGVTSGCSDYEAFYVPSRGDGLPSERDRSDALLGLYDRGVVVMDSVRVINRYDGVTVCFSICPLMECGK